MAKHVAWADDDLKDETPITEPQSANPEPEPEQLMQPERVESAPQAPRYVNVRRKWTPERVQRTMTLQLAHVDALDAIYKQNRKSKTGKSRPDLLEEAIELLAKKYRIDIDYGN